jgi:hypothetical protein
LREFPAYEAGRVPGGVAPNLAFNLRLRRCFSKRAKIGDGMIIRFFLPRES